MFSAQINKIALCVRPPCSQNQKGLRFGGEDKVPAENHLPLEALPAPQNVPAQDTIPTEKTASTAAASPAEKPSPPPEPWPLNIRIHPSIQEILESDGLAELEQSLKEHLTKESALKETTKIEFHCVDSLDSEGKLEYLGNDLKATVTVPEDTSAEHPEDLKNTIVRNPGHLLGLGKESMENFVTRAIQSGLNRQGNPKIELDTTRIRKTLESEPSQNEGASDNTVFDALL